MAVTVTEEGGTSTFQKGLSEWWSEETEYVLQRIERWAAFARGYNRLRSQRLSRGRLTMQEEREPRWSIASNKLVVDDASWSPRFHTLKRCRRKSVRPEETKINCCGTFNYQSNSNLDSTCLESYRYDHSIYFKTIGDIKNSKGDAGDDRISISSEELVEWDAASISESVQQYLEEEAAMNNNRKNEIETLECLENASGVNQSSWPVVDLAKLDLNQADGPRVGEEMNEMKYIALNGGEVNGVDDDDDDGDDSNNNNDNNNDDNNNNSNSNVNDEIVAEEIKYDQGKENVRQNCKGNRNIEFSKESRQNNQKNHTSENQGIKRFLSFRRNRRSSRAVRQPPVIGDNNVVWPGVLLNYTKNIDPASSPHHRCAPK